MTGKEIAEALKRYESTHTGYSYSRLIELWGVIIDEGVAQSRQELMERVGTLEAVVSQFMEIMEEPDLDHEYREAIQDICGLRNPTLDDGIEAVSAAFKSVDQSRKFDDK